MPIITPQWIKEQLDNGRGHRGDLARAAGITADMLSKIIHEKRSIKGRELPLIEAYFDSLDGHGGKQPPSPVTTELHEARDGTEIDTNLDRIVSQIQPAAGPETRLSWLRLMDRLSKLTDEELDYLTVAAEGLRARRIQREE